MTPRSKPYGVKYHWFREHIGPRNIQLVKIDMKDQLGDLFTKDLDKIAFDRLQKQLMGWQPPFVLSRGSIGGILLPTLPSYLPSI
jgi:hypothetical protein